MTKEQISNLDYDINFALAQGPDAGGIDSFEQISNLFAGGLSGHHLSTMNSKELDDLFANPQALTDYVNIAQEIGFDDEQIAKLNFGKLKLCKGESCDALKGILEKLSYQQLVDMTIEDFENYINNPNYIDNMVSQLNSIGTETTTQKQLPFESFKLLGQAENCIVTHAILSKIDRHSSNQFQNTNAIKILTQIETDDLKYIFNIKDDPIKLNNDIDVIIDEVFIKRNNLLGPARLVMEYLPENSPLQKLIGSKDFGVLFQHGLTPSTNGIPASPSPTPNTKPNSNNPGPSVS
ncbi:MAG: hypothetical protein AAF153_00720 [Pseudomonadota bacterium]